jgi:SAM-dependent methyltransferase
MPCAWPACGPGIGGCPNLEGMPGTDQFAHGFFDEDGAASYDQSGGDEFDPAVIAGTVELLADLASGGRALELGIGTGRIALPLSQRGVEIHGIDLSQPMVDALRAKPGGDGIDVTIGDFSTTRVDGLFSLAYLVFNTIENVTSQSEQVACFRNVAAHLEPGGRFLIECAIPDLRRLPYGERFLVFDAGGDHWGIDEYDVSNQGLVSHHFTRAGDAVDYSAGRFRYVWPSELDLMAELAGLRLVERWSGWRRDPFTSESRKHISVWEKPRA